MYIRHFVPLLQNLYRLNDFPSERLIRDADTLQPFTDEFNSRINGSFTPAQVAAELERVRKDKIGTGGLPRLGRSFSGPRFRRTNSN